MTANLYRIFNSLATGQIRQNDINPSHLAPMIQQYIQMKGSDGGAIGYQPGPPLHMLQPGPPLNIFRPSPPPNTN
jgi:hypothetical protein